MEKTGKYLAGVNYSDGVHKGRIGTHWFDYTTTRCDVCRSSLNEKVYMVGDGQMCGPCYKSYKPIG
jgi:hypothetical protein